MKQILGGMFWGTVAGVDALMIVLFVDLYFGGTSVLYWLWDTTSGVWYFAAGGAILGLCFGISKSRNEKPIYKLNPRGVSAGRYLNLKIPASLATVKGNEGKNGK